MVIGSGTFVGTTSGATNDGGASCGLSGGSPDVWFRYSSPVGGQVFADTSGSGYDAVLSAHSGCPGTASNEWTCGEGLPGRPAAVDLFLDAGQEVLFRLSGFAGDSGPWVLEVGPAGAISGTVTDAASGDPLPSVEASVYDDGGGFAGSVSTGPAGSFTFGGLAAGSYFVRARSPEHRDEVYDDLPCPDEFFCDPTGGTRVAVELGATTGGIDFALERLGSISGTLTDSATGDPIPFAGIVVRNAAGRFIESAGTDETGHYTVGGLAAGSYVVLTDARFVGYRDELYDAIPCSASCDLASGTLVAVEFNAETPGIDFGLERLGSISGVVTDAATGDPISFADIRGRFETGTFFTTASAEADASGRYTLEDLIPGDWLVHTREFRAYQDEIYDGVPCPGRCDSASGTPVTVRLATDTPGIDFALEPLGSISGRVTDARTGQPIEFYEVTARDAEGSCRGSEFTDSLGRYTIRGLVAGDYFVLTDETFSPYQDELYDDVPCPRGDCDLAAGTPVAVAFGEGIGGIDFALELLGSISGRVSDSMTGDSLRFANVSVWDAAGDFLGAGTSDETGRYIIDGLPAGSHFVLAASSSYQAELYDDVLCLSDCDPTAGTPIAVSLGADTAGIDFALDRGATIVGTVTDAVTGQPADASLTAWDASGTRLGEGFTDFRGRYVLAGLPAGTYFVTADGFSDYAPASSRSRTPPRS